MAGKGWWVLVAVLWASCAKDLCEEVECRRPASSVCLNQGEVATAPTSGVCDSSTGGCTFREPSVRQCGEGSLCTDGACRCVPSQCMGCCGPSGCTTGKSLTEQSCGLGGAVCARCAPKAFCDPAQGCLACPPEHIVRTNECIDDDVGFEVDLVEGATRWPPPPFDGGITLWHLGPASELTVKVVTRSAAAKVNDSGVPELQLKVSLTPSEGTQQIDITAPSGRSAHHQVSVFATRAISRGAYPSFCYVTREGQLDCGGDRSDAGIFVSVGGDCGLTVEGAVWCHSPGVFNQEFAAVPGITEVSPPCVRTRGQSIFCAEDGGVVTIGGGGQQWKALECRRNACCALEPGGEATCWGSHYYTLFDPLDPSPPPVYPPRSVPGLPGQYSRLTSGEKTFFAQATSGEWSSATNRMGFPGPAPFVLLDAKPTTLKLDSPYHCIMGLEPDGGVWTTQYFGGQRFTPVDGGAGPFIDFAPGLDADFTVLNSEHAPFNYRCPL